MFGRTKALSRKEILRAYEKLKNQYDQFIQKHNHTESIKKQFMDRYLAALKGKVDMSTFFQAEISVLQTFFTQAETKQRELRSEAEQREKLAKHGGVADKVYAQRQERIKKYPELGSFGKNFSREINKLFGAISWFSGNYWIDLERLESKSFGLFDKDQMFRLRGLIQGFMPRSSVNVPSRLSNYYRVAESQIFDPNSLEAEEKRCLYEAADFLGRLDQCLKVPLSDFSLQVEDESLIKKSQAYVKGMISDFRLTDLVNMK